MKGALDRTKVVLRHLPPTISQANLVEHIDSRFSGRYRWILFRPGKLSQKRQIYSRAYIDFNKPDDVIDFAAFFNGHAFVNEKGTQFKAIVEYAPSQHVPKESSKKDGREGTIEKDPEYLEFLEIIAKPVENLPSAEIQLERKEAERAGSQKEALIVTPLMEYVRQKRAAKRSTMNGKLGKRVSGLPPKNVTSGSSKKGSERRNSGIMYVLRESSKNASANPLPKEDGQSHVGKSSRLPASEDTTMEGESGGSTPAGLREKKVILLKGKKTEMLQNAETPSKVTRVSVPSKQIQRHEAGSKIARSIILRREANQDKPTLASQSKLDLQLSVHDNDERTPHASSQHIQRSFEGVSAEKVVANNIGASPENQDRRTRNKDRPDRIVWTPHRASDTLYASHKTLSSSSTKSQSADTEEEPKREVLIPARAGDHRPNRSGRGGHYSAENGRRTSVYIFKDADGSISSEGKPSKRGLSGHGSHEKQVRKWVQKSGSSA